VSKYPRTDALFAFQLRWQRPKMLLRSLNEPTLALLAKRMNKTSSDGLGEYLVAGIEPLCGQDP
jgi:hypothetical protein